MISQILSLIIALTANAADLSQVSTIRLATGSSMSGYLVSMQSELEKETGQKFKFLREEGMSGDSVLIALGSNNADLAFLGNPWDDVMALVKKQNAQIPRLDQMHHEVVGEDYARIITFPGGPKELSKAELKKLFTGEAKSWKEIGGPDLPIAIALPEHSRVGQLFISRSVMDGVDFNRKGAKLFNSYADIVKFVRETPGAISFCPSFVDMTGVNRPKHDKISRSIVGVAIKPISPLARQTFDAFKKRMGAMEK